MPLYQKISVTIFQESFENKSACQQSQVYYVLFFWYKKKKLILKLSYVWKLMEKFREVLSFSQEQWYNYNFQLKKSKMILKQK